MATRGRVSKQNLGILTRLHQGGQVCGSRYVSKLLILIAASSRNANTVAATI